MIAHEHEPSGWQNRDQRLVRNFEFRDFKRAMEFVNQMADVAEELDHHPEFTVAYNRVNVVIYTHDLGKRGLTELDYALAARINDLLEPG
jgi:4a-hydroxytetrahydrobiopterin dehydratase